ncbi:nucleolar DEAD-box protein required for synthesis of 60S ribosomal subunit [Rhizophlyctis rosea]|uniref:RNA helicase n=1 Tax=Rhizophlyctis rosea TaxID=64517 RepID=A0AAD5S791_9FUNG|nr:nucleolar DEAD-box protein required for synthesis of 60S ribosomal subunit [Rhizophlyctis rosea]
MASKKVLDGPFDPLKLGTIEDDDDVPFMDDDDDDIEMNSVPKAPTAKTTVVVKGANKKHPEKALTKKEKKEAKRLAKQTKQTNPSTKAPAQTKPDTAPRKEAELNPDFTFEADGGFGLSGPGHPWDFTLAKAALREKRNLRAETSIDEKIERVRKASKKRKVAVEEVEGGEEIGEEDSEEGEDEVVGMSGDEEEISDEDSLSGEEFSMDVSGDEEEEEGSESEEGGEQSEDDEVTSAPRSNRQLQNASDSETEEPNDILQEKRKAEYFAPAPEPSADESSETFTTMRLSRPILKGVASMGFVKPTAIQSRTIPIALQGTDICGSAVTGSGKTAAFVIPILERLLFRPKNVVTTRVLILVPTRELGAQCHSVAMNLAKFTDIQLCLCVGGLPSRIQEAELRKRPDIVIATPGRLIDHIHNSQSFNLDSIEILIMDEADRMLEDGFAAELNEIIKNTPKTRQTMLFSATMTDNVDDLIKLSLNRPVRLFIDSTTSLTTKLVQEFIRIRSHREESRPAILAALCSRTYKTETIIFFRSKAAAHHMKILFGLLGLKAAELHGNLTQLQRLEALELFRDRKVDFLLATDLASRGLDIAGIKTVINYDMPKNYAQYVHRVGRTARASQSGRAVSLVGEADRQVLKLAIKNSRDEVKHRIVPAEVVRKYEKRIGGWEEEVKSVYREEGDEKELRKAEMEVTKASNLIEYAEEIRGRPARTWFQSEKEKQESKELGLAKHNADFGIDEDTPMQVGKKRKAESLGDKPKRTGMDGLSRHKKRLRLAREEDVKEQAAQVRAARSAKHAARPGKITQLAAPKASGPQNPNKRKGTFDDEIVKGGKKKKDGGGGGAVKKGKEEGKGKGKEEKKRDHKLGKVRSVKSFKSKSKFKRRK